MPIQILVSPDATLPFDDSWELVGTLNPRDSLINATAAKKLHSSSNGGPSLRVDFYLAGDTGARWVGNDSEHHAFGIAFDLFGDRSRVLVARRPAKVVHLAARVPEPHPGSVLRPVFLGIRVTGGVARH